jgi:ribosome maturation factor RimP
MDFAARKALRHRIREMVEPTCNRLQVELVAVELTGDGRDIVLRLAIDKPGGVAISDCSRLSRALGPEFDVEDPIEGPWRLEVSSPGMERPVERPEDFRRFAGFKARVRMDPDWGRRRYKGVLHGLSEDGTSIRILTDDSEHVVPLDRIDRTRLELTPDEFAALGEGPPAIEGELS